MKRVILLIIDALTAPQLLAEMKNGRYPHFQQLKENGVFREQCVSIFPSITHAALTSIATGKYPHEHGVVGSHWYDVEAEKVAYFSGSFPMVMQKGPGDFFREFLLELNHEHLQTSTIFQQLEREGYETACLNFPIYRGDVEHEVNMPLLLKWIPGLPASTTLRGPKKLLLGDLLSKPEDSDVEASLTGVTNWFGFRDENSIDLVLQLAETDEFPDFTLAYFPENDKRSHEEGPEKAHRQLANIDQMLGALFASYDGIDAFLEQFVLVITGDHSQSATVEQDEGEGIDLEQVLSSYQLAEAGQPWQDDDQIMPCPNLRTAHLYFKTLTPNAVNDITEQLLADERVDQVIQRADLTEESAGYAVRTRQGFLRFWRTAQGVVDRYGNQWAWEGDLPVVDGRVHEGVLSFPDYPNAFERIAGVLDNPDSGHVWVTANVGYEFTVPHAKTNPDGGSHASLHRLDSQPPLFVAGAPEQVTIPAYPRIIDVAPLCRACVKAQAD